MYQGSHKQHTEKARHPGSRSPFKRAKAMFMELMELRSKLSHKLHELQIAIDSYPPYVSRGHGWGKHISNRRTGGRWSQDRSKYVPADCFFRGCR